MSELDLHIEDLVAQVGAIGQQEGEREHQREEIDVVVPADAVVDPDAVVVGLLHAGAADAAVFAACRFGELAGPAGLGGEWGGWRDVARGVEVVGAVEDGVVVRVPFQGRGVVGAGDGRGGGAGEVQEQVGRAGEEGDQDVVEPGEMREGDAEERQGRGDEEHLGYHEEGEEEDLLEARCVSSLYFVAAETRMLSKRGPS